MTKQRNYLFEANPYKNLPQSYQQGIGSITDVIHQKEEILDSSRLALNSDPKNKNKQNEMSF